MLKSLLLLSTLYFFTASPLLQAEESKSTITELQENKADEALTDRYIELQKALSSKPEDSSVLHNLSIIEMRQGQLGWALAHSEKSLYVAPLSRETQKLRSKIIDLIIDKRREPPSEQVSSIARTIDYLPTILISILTGLSFFLFIFFATKSYKKSFIEISNNALEKRYMWSFLAVFLLAIPLYSLKMLNFNQRWACIVSPEASILSGPNQKHRLLKKLREGDCLRAKNSKKDWIAVTTDSELSGWISTNDAFLARGRKLTTSGEKQ